jgi:hypothetical protein
MQPFSKGRIGEAAAAEPAWWCHVCMRTVPASQVQTHQHDPGANGPR